MAAELGLKASGISTGCDDPECSEAHNDALMTSLQANDLRQAMASDFGFDPQDDYQIWYEPGRIGCKAKDTARLEQAALEGIKEVGSFHLANREDLPGASFYNVFFEPADASKLPELIKALRQTTETMPLDVGPNRALFPVPIHMFRGHEHVKEPGTVPGASRPEWSGPPLNNLNWRFAVVDSGIDADIATQKLGITPDYDDLDLLKHYTELDRVPGHGTFVAGILDQAAPGIPIISERADAVEYRHGNQPVRMLDERTTLQGVMGALPDVGDRAIVTLSLGSYGRNDSEFVGLRCVLDTLAQQHPDLLIMCAAGNAETSDRFYPAALGVDGIVSVGSGDANGEPAASSNFGDWVEAVARGDKVESYFPTKNFPQGRGFAVWSGTSFATPRAAAELAHWANQMGTGWSPREAWRELQVAIAGDTAAADRVSARPFKADFVGYPACFLGWEGREPGETPQPEQVG